MTKNNKGRAPGKDATPRTTDSQYHTTTDQLIVWFNLAKSSRIEHKPKRGWRRVRHA